MFYTSTLENANIRWYKLAINHLCLNVCTSWKCVMFLYCQDDQIFQIVSSLLGFRFKISNLIDTSIITIPCTLHTDVMGLYFLNYKIYMSQKTYLSLTLGWTDELSSPWASCFITAVMVQFSCIFFQSSDSNVIFYLLEFGKGHIKKHRIGKNIVSGDLCK